MRSNAELKKMSKELLEAIKQVKAKKNPPFIYQRWVNDDGTFTDHWGDSKNYRPGIDLMINFHTITRDNHEQ